MRCSYCQFFWQVLPMLSMGLKCWLKQSTHVVEVLKDIESKRTKKQAPGIHFWPQSINLWPATGGDSVFLSSLCKGQECYSIYPVLFRKILSFAEDHLDKHGVACMWGLAPLVIVGVNAVSGTSWDVRKVNGHGKQSKHLFCTGISLQYKKSEWKLLGYLCVYVKYMNVYIYIFYIYICNQCSPFRGE